MWNKTHFALYSAFARLFVSLLWCTCIGAYMPGTALSGLGGSRLEPPIAPEWFVDPCFLNLMQKRNMDRCMSPLHLCLQQQMHLEQGPGTSTFLQFTGILVSTACYQHLQRQLEYVVVQPQNALLSWGQMSNSRPLRLSVLSKSAGAISQIREVMHLLLHN